VYPPGHFNFNHTGPFSTCKPGVNGGMGESFNGGRLPFDGRNNALDKTANINNLNLTANINNLNLTTNTLNLTGKNTVNHNGANLEGASGIGAGIRSVLPPPTGYHLCQHCAYLMFVYQQPPGSVSIYRKWLEWVGPAESSNFSGGYRNPSTNRNSNSSYRDPYPATSGQNPSIWGQESAGGNRRDAKNNIRNTTNTTNTPASHPNNIGNSNMDNSSDTIVGEWELRMVEIQKSPETGKVEAAPEGVQLAPKWALRNIQRI
jgi:hypothetical protein